MSTTSMGTPILPAFARTSGRGIARKFDSWRSDRGSTPVLDVEGIFVDAVRRHRAGRLADAVAGYRRVLFLKPGYAEVHNNLGVALAAQGKIDEAVARYQCALSLKPDSVDAHNNLGVARAAQGRVEEAITHYESALALNSRHAGAHHNLGIVLAAEGRLDAAVAHYERSILLKPDYADAHNNLGVALAAQDRSDRAMAHYRQAIAIDPHHVEAHNNLGNIFREQGRFDEALAHYGRAIAINPDQVEAHYHRAEVRIFERGDADLAALEALARRDDLPVRKAPSVHFALAKALDDTGDTARALHHLHKGNASKRSQIDYDEARSIELPRRIATVFDKGLFNRGLFEGREAAGERSSVPVFVVGMPRSGSTLIEQILASHPQIHAAGELGNLEKAIGTLSDAGNEAISFPECIPALDAVALRRIGQAYLASLPALAEGKVRIVDKLPGNFLRIGLIRLVLPHARIIHTMRDPVDTCLSCYSKLFTSGQHFSYELGELGRYYRGYSELMAHWRSVLPPEAMLEVSYEDVVDDLEGQARRLIDYCGLPWDDRCIEFYKAAGTVKTASAVQVRRPLFRSSLERWRKYEAGIGPLLDALGDLVPLRAMAANS